MRISLSEKSSFAFIVIPIRAFFLMTTLVFCIRANAAKRREERALYYVTNAHFYVT